MLSPDKTKLLGSPRSIHTDTDVAMEMGGLGMGSSRPETRRVMPWTEALPEQTRMLSAPDLVSSLTKGMAWRLLHKSWRSSPIHHRWMMRQMPLSGSASNKGAAATWVIPVGMESSAGRVSAFDRLGHWAQTPQKEEEWEPRPEMTPQKVDRGCQSSRTASSEPPHSTSQKRQSQSRPRDEGESKKGRMENEGRSSKVQVRIDWSTTGIQKPVSKPDP